MDRSNGVETSIPGTTQQQEQPQAQPVPSLLYNRGGNTVLQNEAGSIHTRPDGSTVLIGSDGQTLVTNGRDSDDDEQDDDDISGPSFHSNNVIINGRSVHGGGSIFTGNGGSVLVNHGGEGSYQSYNNYQLRLVNGGLQLTVGGKEYNFLPKATNSQEKVDINGQQATVDYENGNIVVQLADGTVLAKTETGLFSGSDRQSYDNRKKIQEDAAREAEQVQQHIANLQRDLQENLAAQMKQLQENLQLTLGNIRF